jgi:hypothetical protein
MTEFLKALNASGSEGASEEGFGEHDDEDEDGEDEIPGAVTEPNAGLPAVAEKDGEEHTGEEVAHDEPIRAIHALLDGKVSPEIMVQVGQLLEKAVTAEGAESDDDEDNEGEDENSEEEDDAEGEDEDEEDDMNKDLVTKPAMDAAIQSAVAVERKRASGIDDAKRAVRPWVGELSMAFDSGEGVYRKALTMLGVDGAKTIHASALASVLKLVPRPGQHVTPAREVSLGMDAAASADFSKMFPGAARIEIAY